jgi:hypothetical protein
MKVALCFIISYEHILNKENIWREWIDSNKDIINVYFYYKDITKIKSKWIIEHTIPPNYIFDTSYFHVIPAYLSVMKFAFSHDDKNKWFCLLTDACCPIISPKRFRYLFYKYSSLSFFSWDRASWNPEYHKRSNLAKLPKELWLANDPWFTLTRENVKQIFHFVLTQPNITKTICDGGLANESLFAIIFKFYGELETESSRSCIRSVVTHLTDWSRRSTSTSPHVFKEANEEDIKFINKELERNFYCMFIRKISPQFPDEILRNYIYQYRKKEDDELILNEPLEFIFNKYLVYMKKCFYFLACIMVLYTLYLMLL